MPTQSENSTILTTQVRINPEFQSQFIDWQAHLNQIITKFSGFVSLEISSSPEYHPFNWMIVQRFNQTEDVRAWQKSPEHQKLMEELKNCLTKDMDNLRETEIATPLFQGNVTEVFVTQIDPTKEKDYREWMAKIHQVEAKFPGFRGVYVQSPRKEVGGNWITLLQFDTPENLDRWLTSKEREQVLSESRSLIESLENHRVISPYAGWFASVTTKDGKAPPGWKQTMLILLVLFPIVMLEMRYLSLLTANLNHSLATFISNAISVSLITWPMMPLAIRALGWWFVPKKNQSQATFWGTILIFLLYLIEIIVFWYLL